ncbi:MAG: methionine synthase [Fervidicoccaceae archaeon]|nr:MAG: methionine synthase [Fervidicoccus fontis]
MKVVELPILPISVIGSYPKPKWLREMIKARKRGEIDEAQMEEAFRDAVTAVVKEQEIMGVDIPSDGEMRREEMVEYFAERIEGFKFFGNVRVWGNNYFRKPGIVGPLKWKGPMTVEEFRFLREVSTSLAVKVPITGPYTIADWSYIIYYKNKEEATFELAKIINKELKSLEEAGATFVQIDEPALTTHPEEMEWAVEAINEAVSGINMKIGLHVCYSDYRILRPYYDRLRVSQFALEFANRGFSDLEVIKGLNAELGFGVVDVHNRNIETPESVEAAITKVMNYVKPECLYINPDCGLKLLPRAIAKEKLRSIKIGTEKVRKKLAQKGIEKIVLTNRKTCNE